MFVEKTAVSTPKAPGAVGPYSQGVTAGGMIYVSGQLPFDPATGEIPQDVERQAEQALKNLKAVLEAAGSGLENVVKTTVFLKSMQDFVKINGVYASFFKDPFPARSCVEVSRLPKDALLEIEAVAIAG